MSEARVRATRVAGALGLLCMLATSADAAETQWWVANRPADYAKAGVRGVVVDADGVLRAGLEARREALDSLRTPWAMARLDDGSIVIAGDRGRVLRWTAGGGVRPWANLGAGQVLSLCADGDGVLAGTGPRGLVYRIGARGDTTRLATTGERYVWGIAPAGRGAWWLATGTRGRLLRLASGRTEVVFDSDESNLVSLTVDASGAAVAGGDSRGRVYRVARDGAAGTLLDAAEDEIRALAVDAAGVVWAAALSSSAVSDEGDDDDKPRPTRPPVPSGRGIVYRVAPDSGAVAWWTSPQPLIYSLLPRRGAAGPLVGTGGRAGLYAIERPQGAAAWFAPEEAQVTAMLGAPDGTLFVTTANPPALWRLGPGTTREGTLTAPVLDARRFARFGRLRWQGAGAPRFETRSGNSDEADTTWSAWAATVREGDGEAIRSPGARHLQWRAMLAGDARVDEVAVSWREQNLAPRVEELTVAPQAEQVREGELSVRNDAVTQTLPGGQRVEYSINLSSAKGLRELPLWARGLRTLQWRGSDPNGDVLRYQVAVRSEPAGPWIEIGKDLRATVHTWDTVTLPDGRYRVRVVASDGEGNAIGEDAQGEAVSEPFGVDNTPPAVRTLAARIEQGRVHVSGAAEDATSTLWRLEVAVDDGTWRTVTPRGGLADRRTLEFDVRLDPLAAGDHLVSVRAVDQAGNAATRALTVAVPRAR